ncbi:hypothetical protein [Spirosoma lituiforme]
MIYQTGVEVQMIRLLRSCHVWEEYVNNPLPHTNNSKLLPVSTLSRNKPKILDYDTYLVYF